MSNQKIILNSSFTLFCTSCGTVIASDIFPVSSSDARVNVFLLAGYKCPRCNNDSEFNIIRSEIKRLIIE